MGSDEKNRKSRAPSKGLVYLGPDSLPRRGAPVKQVSVAGRLGPFTRPAGEWAGRLLDQLDAAQAEARRAGADGIARKLERGRALAMRVIALIAEVHEDMQRAGGKPRPVMYAEQVETLNRAAERGALGERLLARQGEDRGQPEREGGDGG